MVDITSLRHLYPFQSHYLQLGGHKLHYIDEGEGEVLLMLHGNPTWSFYYRKLIQHFSKNHRVIAPDHMGCGLSDKPQDYPYTLETHIQNLTSLINHLKLSSITLLVHDWGGPIGLGYAIEHALNIKRLVVFNTGAFIADDLDMPLRIKICRFPVLGPFFIRRLNLFAKGALWMATHKKLTKDIKKGYLAPYSTFEDRIAILRFVQNIPWDEKHPSYAIIQKISENLPLFKDVPILIMWGAKDFCFTEKFLKYWSSYFPKAIVKVISDAGHYVVEDAAQEIITVLQGFLKP